MLLGDFNSIYIGDTSIDAVYIGSDLVWSAEIGGLDPYDRNWNLYGVQPCEYKYLNPGILLKGLSDTGSYMFTCAESPERIDFTTIKSVQIKYTGYDGVTGTSGGVASIPVTHSTNPKSQIIYTALELADAENTTVTLNCEAVGGQQFLLLYSDLDYTMQITDLQINHYQDTDIVDLSSATWEQRNFQYESDTVITCTNDIQIPVGASDIAIHVSTHDSGGLKSCLAFLDENKNIISYGDNWQGTNPTGVAVSTHFQSIPSNAAYFQIAVGRAPNMTSPISPQDLKSCIVCYSMAETMPHLDGVLCYYDCDDGIGTEGGNPVWINRVSGGSDMILHNASVAQDGAISFYGGDDPGNGKFSCNTTESATMYVLFKRTGDGNADNYIHICGSVANGQHFPYVGGSSALWIHGIQFMLNSNVYTDAYTGLFQYDITGNAIRDFSLSCLNYHVVCCVRQKNGAVYDNLMYVDGTYIGRVDGSSYPPGTNYGVCIGVDSFGYEDKTHDGYDTLIKMIAVSNQANTAQQVTENSLWLLNHFNIYTPLEYIQSTNCQTINTGYTPNENSRIEAEFMLYTSVHNEFGQALFGNGTWKMFYNRNRTLQTEYQFGSGNITTTASVLPYHKRFKLVCDKNGATWYDTEGVQIGNVSVTGTSPGSSPLYIGSTSNTYYSEYRLYSFKIYENDTLVMNLIPVQRNEDGVCGLLDQVSQQFFVDTGVQNAGYYSDVFTDSYMPIDAVDTSGNMYVDTGYIPDEKTKVIIDSIPIISSRSGVYNEILLGTMDSLKSPTYSFGFAVRDVNNKPYYFRGSSYLYFGNTDMMQRRSTITLYMDTAVVKFDDETTVQSTIPTPSSYDNVASLWLFNSNVKTGTASTAYSYSRFYNCKIFEVNNSSEELIHNFIAAKRRYDNIIVLYDTVTNSEYPAVGGSFKDATIMPTMDGVTDYFDCKYGASENKWENKVVGGNDATFTGMSVQSDGSIGIMGTADSYGYFDSTYSANRTVYVVFKAPLLGIVNLNRHIIGSCGGNLNNYRQGAWFSVSIDGYAAGDRISSDQWGIGIGSNISSEDYHVVAITRNSGVNTLFVDGSSVGTLSNSVQYSDHIGVGVLIDDYMNIGVGRSSLQQIKMIAIGNTVHTSEQIAENTSWLRNYYNLD